MIIRNLFRDFICWLFGHKSICLFSRLYPRDHVHGSMVTGWKCERCEYTFYEQWDE